MKKIITILITIFFTNIVFSQDIYTLSVDIKYDSIVSLDGEFFAVKENGKWGVVKNRKQILPTQFDGIDALGDGVISFVSNNKIGFADTLGNILLEATYPIEKQSYREDFSQINVFDYGAALVEVDGRYQLIDKQNKQIIAQEYEITSRIGDAVAIKKNGKYGIANSKGKILLYPQYLDISILIEGKLYAYKQISTSGLPMFGLINGKGEKISEAIYADFGIYNGKKETYLKAYTQEGGQALLDDEGKIIIPPIYQVILPTILPKYFAITQNLEEGIIGKDKNGVKPFFYYIITIFIGITGILLLSIFNMTDGRPLIKNIPMYYIIFTLAALCVVAVYHENASTNSLLSLFCLIVFILAVLYVEPIVFFFLAFAIGTPIITKFFMNGDSLSAFSFIILFTIFDCLSLFRWGSIKSELTNQKRLTDQNEKLEREIELASTLQQNFYRQKQFFLNDWDLGYYCKPMVGVSGDLFDFYVTKTVLDGLGIFDISGHGISSGLLTMLVKTILHNEFYNQEYKNLDDIVYRINDRIIEEKGNVQNYITGILAKTTETGIDFVLAGHPTPIIYKSETNKASYYEYATEDFPNIIGMKEIQPYYKVESVTINKNDIFVLYTDGIIELRNANGEMFGKDRFLSVIEKNGWKSVNEQVELLKCELAAFLNGHPQNDDITFIILKHK